MQKNGIRAFRRRLGISQSELARRAKTSRQQLGRLEQGKRKLTMQWATDLAKVLNCQPSDLMFPENARLGGGSDYRNVFLVKEEGAEDQAISFHEAILKKLLMEATSNRLELCEVDDQRHQQECGQRRPSAGGPRQHTVSRPGIYLIDIAGARSWRYLSPSATGRTIVVHSDNEQMVPETVAESELTILGQARLKLSAL